MSINDLFTDAARQLLGDAHALVNASSLDVVTNDDDAKEADA